MKYKPGYKPSPLVPAAFLAATLILTVVCLWYDRKMQEIDAGLPPDYLDYRPATPASLSGK